jgi:hypothetical protein
LPQLSNFVGPDAQIWNFTIYHNCGHPFPVHGYDACDIVAGGCPRCGATDVALTDTGSHQSFQIFGLFRDATAFSPGQSARSFADLRNAYPAAWRALRMDALIAALAAGAGPALPMWPVPAVRFLTEQAAEIQQNLS